MRNSAHKLRRRPSSAELSRWFHAACRQEVGALQQLFVLYRPLLLKLAHDRLTGALRTKVAPSDVVQTTLWKATQNFSVEEFRGRSGFVAWLVTILKNEAADTRRRYQEAKKRDVSRERSLFSAETQNWLKKLSASFSASDDLQTYGNDAVERLLAAVERLPAHYKLVLRMRYYDKLEFGAIGEKLERTYDAARVLHNRALLILRKELNKNSESDSATSL